MTMYFIMKIKTTKRNETKNVIAVKHVILIKANNTCERCFRVGIDA